MGHSFPSVLANSSDVDVVTSAVRSPVSVSPSARVDDLPYVVHLIFTCGHQCIVSVTRALAFAPGFIGQICVRAHACMYVCMCVLVYALHISGVNSTFTQVLVNTPGIFWNADVNSTMVYDVVV